MQYPGVIEPSNIAYKTQECNVKGGKRAERMNGDWNDQGEGRLTEEFCDLLVRRQQQIQLADPCSRLLRNSMVVWYCAKS